MSTSTTNVAEVELDIDSLLSQPGAANVMVPAGDTKKEKPSLFSNKKEDFTFLDKLDDDQNNTPEAIAEAEAKKQEDIKNGILNADGTSKSGDDSSGADALDEVVNSGKTEKSEEDTDSKDPKKGGRPTGLVELGTKLIEKGYLTPFEGDEDVSKYTLKDWEDLFEVNSKEREKKIAKDISTNFFDNLPEELQYAAKYVADGGNDLKGLFRALSDVKETKDLDPSTDKGREAIAREYLLATNFGTSEEIEEQVNEWKDQDLLDKKANNFKPKLDAIKEAQIAKTLHQQEVARRRQQEQSEVYTENVYKVLDAADLNGLKLDKKTQSTLYAGLVNPSYPSISGRKTNMLGHLLEKYQWVEPRHDLIAEALWLLQDPEGYKNKVREVATKAQVASTIRQLKTEERNKNTSGLGHSEEEEQRGTGKSKGLQRPNPGFFKR